tara:strand:- start:181073 stop:181360 length:288 start_codon:yes stop_codon:yes gene_type:complete
MSKLTESQIQERLQQFSGWEYVNEGLETTLEFETFKDCFSIMTRIAFEVEAQNHHPEWCNVYNKLSIRLSTHDAKGVTEKDFNLLQSVENIITNQ